MKVLNRPMFRIGGPIKEGIMSGIKEPRQRYAEPPGFVVQSDPNKIILNRLLNNQNNAARVFENVGKTIQDNKDFEILAIGIGHDVTRYYKKAVKIADVQELGDVMINQLTKLLSEKNKTIH